MSNSPRGLENSHFVSIPFHSLLNHGENKKQKKSQPEEELMYVNKVK
jgi:hypothetical protein